VFTFFDQKTNQTKQKHGGALAHFLLYMAAKRRAIKAGIDTDYTHKPYDHAMTMTG